MARDNTLELAQQISMLSHKLDEVRQLAESIRKTYDDTPASAVVAGVQNIGDPIPGAADLTKNEYLLGITMCEQIRNFFENQAVIQGDYWSTVNKFKTLTRRTGL